MDRRPYFDLYRAPTFSHKVLAVTWLNQIFETPPPFTPSPMNALAALPQGPVPSPITHVEQFGYALGFGEELLRTGPVSNCVVITLFNRHAPASAPRAAMIHVALENATYVLEGLMEDLQESNAVRQIINDVSGGDASHLEANVLGGFANALAFWEEYLKIFGVNHITVHYFPAWGQSEMDGETAEEAFNSLKNGDAVGFIQLSCAHGDVTITNSGAQFLGKVGFFGESPFRACSLVKNQLLINFYRSAGIPRTAAQWLAWPGHKDFSHDANGD